MEPSLWKLKGPDQTFSSWVRGDYEARKPVFSHIFFMCPPNQCSPSLFVTSELKFMIFSICSCELTWLFSCLGTTAASTCWNTLQSGKVDGFLSSQLEWSSSSAKFYTWNWLMNEDFNTRSKAREFIEEAMKKAAKKYKWSRGAPDRTPTLHSVAEECKVLPCFFKTMSL